ncbi:hypothetical protein RhiirC2_786577 [Rhizophagus irregularis]|uniref:Uncharacterized protein n=1 Tax=Rhizophagus irregularis TaxID=588596 RepID=A0A2N1MU43_9GLOM|nr:hypothetical protein RhiirC2_786577 [Rhizophagus irregularis]
MASNEQHKMESRELEDQLREKGIEVTAKEQIIKEKDEENKSRRKMKKNKSLFGRLKRRNTMEEDTSKLDNNGKKSPVTKAKKTIFDVNMLTSLIKKRHVWQAVKKLEENVNKDNEFMLTRDFQNKLYLIYFNNENDLIKAIYESTTNDKLEAGLQLKIKTSYYILHRKNIVARDDEVERLKAECRSLRGPPEVKAGGVSRSRSSST